MRLVFKVGLVPEADMLRLQASAESAPAGRWLNASIDIKAIAALLTIALTLVGMRVDTSSRLTRLEQWKADTELHQQQPVCAGKS